MIPYSVLLERLLYFYFFLLSCFFIKKLESFIELFHMWEMMMKIYWSVFLILPWLIFFTNLWSQTRRRKKKALKILILFIITVVIFRFFFCVIYIYLFSFSDAMMNYENNLRMSDFRDAYASMRRYFIFLSKILCLIPFWRFFVDIAGALILKHMFVRLLSRRGWVRSTSLRFFYYWFTFNVRFLDLC